MMPPSAPLNLIDLATAYNDTDFSGRVWSAFGAFQNGRDYAALNGSIDAYLKQGGSEHHTLDLSHLDTSKDGKQLFAEQKLKMNRRWRWFLVAQFIAWLAFTALVSSANDKSVPAGDPDVVTGGVILLMLLLLGEFVWYWYRRADVYQKCMLPPATSILKSDTRRPVLLIRSFLDDGAKIYRIVQEGKTDVLESSRFEEAFTPTLKRFGPVIAVGNPREDLPEAGAARAHFTDADWKQPVLDMIQQSRLIVLISEMKRGSEKERGQRLASGDLFAILDLTPGVKWEVEHIMKSEHQSKLLILVKPERPSFFFRWVLFWVWTFLAPFVALARSWLRLRPSVGAHDIVALHCPKEGDPLVLAYNNDLHTQEVYERAITIACHEIFCRTGAATAAASSRMPAA